MRSASTQNRIDLIKRELKSSNCKSTVQLEWDNSGTWTKISDVDTDKGVDWDESAKRYKYANWGLTPLASSISFNIINENGKYSPGSGESEAGRFDLNSKIRLKAGYILENDTELTETTASVTLDGGDAFHFYTQVTGGYVTLLNSKTTTDIYFTDIYDNYYDGGYYDGDTYEHVAYYLTTYDFTDDLEAQINSIDVTCNTAEGNIYWRAFSDKTTTEATQRDSTSWTDGGSTANGTVNVEIGENKRYLQISISLGATAWSDDLRITAIDINYYARIEWLYYNVYYLDNPVYTDPPAPSMPLVLCKGRDILKYALETEINLEDLSGGVAVDDLIKSVCDSINISYTDDSIADLSDFADRTLATGWGSTNIKNKLPKAIDIFEACMQIINSGATDRYWMYTEYDETTDDNVLFIQVRSTDVLADYVLNYHNYISLGNKKKNYDKLLQRLTVITNSQVPDAESELDTEAISTTGAKTLSWANNAAYKRLEVDLPDNITITTLVSNPQSITFTVTAVTGTVNVTAHGNTWGTDPTFEGEDINYDNMVVGRGKTALILNPLVVSDNEAQDIAQAFTSDHGSPAFEANQVTWPYCNLLLELNDVVLLWSKWTYTDDLFYVVSIKHHWDNSQDSTNWNLDDSGQDFSDAGEFIYDDVMDYDRGYVFDMVHGVGATAADIDTSVYVNDTGYQ